MSKRMVQPERPQMTIWRDVACSISKATRAQAHVRVRAHTRARTHTHTELCNTYRFFTVTKVLWMQFNVTLHAHCPSCLTFSPNLLNCYIILLLHNRMCCNQQPFCNAKHEKLYTRKNCANKYATRMRMRTATHAFLQVNWSLRIQE